jgi:hypothetical protein
MGVGKQGVCGKEVSLTDISNLSNLEQGLLSVLFVYQKCFILFVFHVLGPLIFRDMNFSLT